MPITAKELELRILDAMLDDFEEVDRRRHKLKEEIKKVAAEIYKLQWLQLGEMERDKDGRIIKVGFGYRSTDGRPNFKYELTPEEDGEDHVFRMLRLARVY